ncbi:V-snare-domain-containing protein [Eremomyces bilateralis CBS 781.70]|uniref:Protein transport protein BOS1 n=1 Tax=Eremomyces bilateralis CBS 781.70 TaxID=1392243 RepID=A0A6G1G0E0_9PEZI|nr:V-snare-domain-containing protein [Eremomyces bilateralis CBS 781.70]KAF1811575.1 V-snare-domain-containing protein [Eremomyces bilateralis CBS 781.70]
MNPLFNSAHRQSNSIRKDLDSFAQGNSGPAVQGQIHASLTSFSRTIDEYHKLARQEIVQEKQEKAYDRVKNFRAELADYRERFESLRREREEKQTTLERNELLGRRPHHAATPENPYSQPAYAGQSPFAPAASSGSAPSAFGTTADNPYNLSREQHALREQSFSSRTNTQLDEYIDRGRAVLADLGDQREMLKGTQRKLLSVANTLGISGETIRMVERRVRQDKWIFWAGLVLFFAFAWLVLWLFRWR